MSRRHLAELSNSDNPRTTVTQAAGTSSVPEFLLESNHPTVLALWTEWYIGIGDRPSITTMIQKKLPKSEKQRKLFARWKVVIDEVSRLAREQVVPESEVVKKLDEYRGRNKLSITKLQEEIKRKRANKESIV